MTCGRKTPAIAHMVACGVTDECASSEKPVQWRSRDKSLWQQTCNRRRYASNIFFNAESPSAKRISQRCVESRSSAGIDMRQAKAAVTVNVWDSPTSAATAKDGVSGLLGELILSSACWHPFHPDAQPRLEDDYDFHPR